MKAAGRRLRKAGWAALVAGGLAALAGCSGDVVGEIGRNVQVRDRVMGAIAADSALAVEMTHRMLGNPVQHRRVVETVLSDDRAAQYILARIGRNSDAVDYVLQSAAADSAGRAHLMTLLRGMQIAMQKKK